MRYAVWVVAMSVICLARTRSTCGHAAEPVTPGDVIESSVGMKLVVIPAGEFEMGSEINDERPVHPVRITKPFLMGMHEVTVGEFRKFYDDGYEGKLDCEVDGKGGMGYTSERDNEFAQRADFGPWNWGHPNQTNSHPVVNVSWNDAAAFCAWLSRKEGKKYRLPTEAEWEYACGAGAKTRFWNGDDDDGVIAVGNVADAMAKEKLPRLEGTSRRDGHAFTAPVGSFRANPFGLHDMHGNVEEWCGDWWGDYTSSPAADPRGPDGGWFRVKRGGNWSDHPARCRTSNRSHGTPSLRLANIGFRVVCELE